MTAFKHSDQEFAAAVAASHSWRGVLRELGMKGLHTATARRRAARLGLDTSHFTGQRPWSNQQLEDAVSSSSSWNEVCTKLLTDPRTAKRHATSLGLKVAHLERRNVPSVEGNLIPCDANWQRAAAHWAVAWFYAIGGSGAVVSEQEPFDLYACLPGDRVPQRVQIKTSNHRVKPGRWGFNLTVKAHKPGGGQTLVAYDPKSVDLFFLVAVSGDAWLVPSARLASQTGCQPGPEYDQYKVNDGPLWSPVETKTSGLDSQ